MRVRVLVGAIAVVLAARSAAAQSVTYDYAKGTDFSRVKTYAWGGGTGIKDELNRKRLVDAVEAQLAAKGLTKAEGPAPADVLVSYTTNFERELDVSAWGSGGVGPYGLGGNRFGSARAREVSVGTLTVDMIEAASHSVIWRGTATQELDPKANAEKKDKQVNQAAQKIFRNYPPKQ